MPKKAIQLSDHFTYSRLLRFVLPCIGTMLFTSIYGIVDGLCVSNFVGKTAFAAVNLIMPLPMLIGSVGFMLGTGGSAIVGITLGEGDQKKADRYFTLFLLAALVSVSVLAVLGIVFLRPIAVLLGAKGELLDYAVRYGKEKDRYYSYERFSQEIDAILQYLISHQIALEVNTAGLRMLGFTNPHPDVIRRYREMGGELITVGSDGHVPEYLGYGFDRLPELLSDCGFDSYTVFRKGKPEFRKVLVKI